MESPDLRANQVKRALMVHLVLLAQRVFQVTSAHQDKMAPRVLRESKAQEGSQVQQEHLGFRVMRDQLGQLDPLEPRAGLGGRDSLD